MNKSRMLRSCCPTTNCSTPYLTRGLEPYHTETSRLQECLLPPQTKTNLPSSVHQQDVQSQKIPIGNSRRLSTASDVLLAIGTISSQNSSKPSVSAKRLTKTASSSAILFLAALLCTLQLTLMTLSISLQIRQWSNNSKQIFWHASKSILWVKQTTILEHTSVGNAIPTARGICTHTC
jgi:hypothetical protein